MAKPFNEVKKYIGNLDQLLTFTEARLTGGFQEGVRVMRVDNGGNLSVTVLPDRCMDIYQVRYKGKNINYISPAGIVAPQYYDASGSKWLRNFFAGMLTTCGLQNFGAVTELPDGEVLGLHGRMTNTPAANVKYARGMNGDTPALSLEGTMNEATMFGENLSLHRKLDFEYENDGIVLTDTITNNGFGPRQFVYLLHLNYGYPLLQEGTKLVIDSLEVTPRSDESAAHMDDWNVVETPAYPYPERCYFHKLKKADGGSTGYGIFNEELGIGVKVSFNGDDLPYFCQWKYMQEGEYVMGLEPMNANLDGPKPGQEGCEAPVLDPGQSKTYTVKLEFTDTL